MKQGLKSYTTKVNFGVNKVEKSNTNNALKKDYIPYSTNIIIGEDLLVHNSNLVAASKSCTSSTSGFTVNVSGNCPVIKLHFSLRGQYTNTYKNTSSFKAHIPDGYCNMLYVPLLNCQETYSGKHHKTLEIYISQKGLEKIVGDNFNSNLEQFFSKVKSLEPGLYYKKNKQITVKFKNQINEILQCKYTGILKENYLKSRLTVLLIDFLMKTANPVAEDVIISESDYLALVRVEKYCKQNLKEKLTINHLSLIAGFNTTKLKRDFKKVYKTTIFKHITQLRMQKAKELIQEKGLSIAEVSYEVGYSNPQHFTAAFKKTIGYLPSKLVK